MNYTLHQLAIFLRVSQTKSITKTAEEMHLTPPAVSIQLKNFQSQFDLPLTEVINKRLYITDFGQELAKAAENILNEAYAIENKTMEYRGKMNGRLKISVVSTGKYVIPYFLSGFLSQHEAVELELDVSNKFKVVEHLEKNELDFALVSALPQQIKLKKIELMDNKLFMVGSGQEGEGKLKMDKKRIIEGSLIYREKGSSTRQYMEKFMEKSRIQSKKKLELTSNEAVKQAVIAGLGNSIVPLIGIRNELMNHQLKIIPVTGLPIKTSWNLVWLNEKRLSPVAEAFIEYLKKEKSEIIRKHFSWTDSY